jgi:WD40 repeat protein
VTSVAFSPDGKTIASGSWDKTIRLWDRDSKQEIAALKGHSSYVSSVVFSPDGNIIASGSDDHTIRLWDWESKQEIATLNGHSLPVTGVAFSPDGKTIASGSWDKTIRLWDRHSKQEIAVLKGHAGWVTSIAFSPDGKTIASGSYDNTTRLWDIHIFNLFLKGGKPTPLFKTFSKGVLFFWGAELEGFEYKKVDHSSDYDERFRPLLKKPAPGQTKFEQILQWAEKQVKGNR